MTNDEEETMIVNKLIDARCAVNILKKEIRLLKLKLNTAESEAEFLTQAAIDYMEGNGLLSTERLRLRSTTSIDVLDVEDIPEKYQRIKKEANKALIKQDMPEGANWYTVVKSKFITIKGE